MPDTIIIREAYVNSADFSNDSTNSNSVLQSFSNPEDSKWLANTTPKQDPNVERVRR